jgi:hypothetical protein
MQLQYRRVRVVSLRKCERGAETRERERSDQ